MHRLSKTLITAVTCILAASIPVSAHVGVGPVDTFHRGLLHPIAGIDHVIVMIAVGLFAAKLGGRAVWLVPLSFVVTMIIGGIIGYYGWSLPMVETVIGFSVVVMSMAVALGARLPTTAATALVGVFALFHGHAHGTEGAGLSLAFIPYAVGFVAATITLHGAGVAFGVTLDRLAAGFAVTATRIAGIAGVIAGVSLLTGALVA